MKQKSVQDLSVLGHFAKTDVRYWQRTIFRQTYTRDGETRVTKDWAMKIAHVGRRETFPLGTPNKAAAAAKARDIYLLLVASGWEITLRRYKASLAVPKKVAANGGTVGDFLAELSEKSDAKPKTLEGYAVAFRKIVADVVGQGHGRGGGATKRTAWRQAVEAVALADLTPAKVQHWKLSFVANAGDDPVRQRAARVSANAFLRRAKSLFAPSMTKHLERVMLPTPLPFDGAEFYNRTSMRYQSGFDVLKLIRDAKKELARSEPEQYKVFLLAVMAGLRRREIDTLEWSAFRWDRRMIQIAPTKWFHPKSEDSIGEVEIDRELVQVFRKNHAKAKGPFVIESKGKAETRREMGALPVHLNFRKSHSVAPKQRSDYEDPVAHSEKRIWEYNRRETRYLCCIPATPSRRHNNDCTALSGQEETGDKRFGPITERGQLVRLTKPRRKQARKKNDCQTGYRVEGAPRAPLLSRTAAFVRG